MDEENRQESEQNYDIHLHTVLDLTIHGHDLAMDDTRVKATL